MLRKDQPKTPSQYVFFLFLIQLACTGSVYSFYLERITAANIGRRFQMASFLISLSAKTVFTEDHLWSRKTDGQRFGIYNDLFLFPETVNPVNTKLTSSKSFWHKTNKTEAFPFSPIVLATQTQH